MYKVEMYETPMGNKPIEKYLEKLIAQHKENELTEILLYIDKLKEYGFNINKNFTVKAIKPIREQVYELRPSSTRVFFFYYKEGVFVLLHAYEKKTNTTDPKEIDKAIKEKKNLIKRK